MSDFLGSYACQAPLSMEFSRQEYWSGLSLPSPMHKSEKLKWSRSVVSDPQRPHGLQPSRLLLALSFFLLDVIPLNSQCVCSLYILLLMYIWVRESISHSTVFDSTSPWTVALQAPLSMGFSRQEYGSGLPFPPPGIFLTQGSNPPSPASPALAGGFFTTSTTWDASSSKHSSCNLQRRQGHESWEKTEETLRMEKIEKTRQLWQSVTEIGFFF